MCFIDFLKVYLILDENFNIIMTIKVPWYFSIIAWGTPSFFFVTKNTMGTFRKLRNTPTHPLGTFRHAFHQKSICTPPVAENDFD